MSDEPPDVAEGDNVVEFLKDYRTRREQFHVFDDYDKSMAQMRSTASAEIEKLTDPLKPIASRLFSIAERGFFLLQVSEWKIDYIAEALLHSIDAKNALALANNARALLEHIAAMVALLAELETLDGALRGQNDERAIDRALAEAEGLIHRAYYGTSPKTTPERAKQALHIDDCLEVLQRDIPDAEEIYDFLCEYVHPNYGSNVLVSSGQLGTGRLKPPQEYHRDTIERIRGYCTRCMRFLAERGVQHASVFIRLQGLLELCFVPGAKVTNAFSKRSPKPTGDGKSQATAYSFPKARTAQEAIQMCLAFLENANYKVFGRQQGGFGENVIYDVYQTDHGAVWFKVPMIRV